jgi:hypothetical protein
MARTNAVHDRNILGFSFFFAEPYALLRGSGQPHYLTEWQRGISRSRLASRLATGNPDFSS